MTCSRPIAIGVIVYAMTVTVVLLVRFPQDDKRGIRGRQIMYMNRLLQGIEQFERAGGQFAVDNSPENIRRLMFPANGLGAYYLPAPGGIDQEGRIIDLWGNAILCAGNAHSVVGVISAGPNGKFGDADDVSVFRSSADKAKGEANGARPIDLNTSTKL